MKRFLARRSTSQLVVEKKDIYHSRECFLFVNSIWGYTPFVFSGQIEPLVARLNDKRLANDNRIHSISHDLASVRIWVFLKFFLFPCSLFEVFTLNSLERNLISFFLSLSLSFVFIACIFDNFFLHRLLHLKKKSNNFCDCCRIKITIFLPFHFFFIDWMIHISHASFVLCSALLWHFLKASQ